VACGALINTRALAQDVSLLCVNDLVGPINLPIFPQVLNVNVYVLTNTYTPANSHGVTVVRTRDGNSNNVALLNFDTLAQGAVYPNYGSTTISYGQASSGQPKTYQMTLIGTYSMQGDNFPLSAWPNNPNWVAPPVTDTLQFNLDEALGWQPTSDNSKQLEVQSNYSYTNWGWISFLGFEDPYTPGATAAAPTTKDVVFDLRGTGPKQAPSQPYSCFYCQSCNLGGGLGKNMAIASLDIFQAGVAIRDTPIGYTPQVGVPMNFTITYHQRETGQPKFCSNVGLQWNVSWIECIGGGPPNEQADATFYAGDGNQFIYGGYAQNAVQGLGSTPSNSGVFTANDGWTHARLSYFQSSTGQFYQRTLPDGTVETYGQQAGTPGHFLFFLTSIVDPRGNVTTLTYDPTAAANGEAVLTAVTDPDSGQLVFGYNTSSPLQIAKVTRTIDGLSATFSYSQGEVASTTDPSGITSSFLYSNGAFIMGMTTPYGTTRFGSSDSTSCLEADMTNPLGQTERVEYQESLSNSLAPASDSSVPSASNLSIDNSNLNHHTSYYWTRREYSDGVASGGVDSAGFYGTAEVYHWAEGGEGSIAVPLSKKMPLEGRVWYNYPSQPSADYVIPDTPGGSTSPSITARLLDSGATQASYASYNSGGLITQTVDPIGRTTNYSYYSNNIDLYQVTQANGSGQDVLMTYNTYNNQHEPLSMIDAAGQSTSLTYATNGQMLTRTVTVSGNPQTTTFSYSGSGGSGTGDYLTLVTGPISGATTSYTYDSAERVRTATDSEGYTITSNYDNLDRLTSTVYPDGTSDQTVYNKLDVDHTIDRQGRLTQNWYDAIRELMQTRDPLGRNVKYTWCLCGGLSTLTDPNNNVTTWGLDTQGRVTSKKYADSSTINYTYESDESRLHSMTDARGSGATYAYNTDDTLSSVTYSPGSGVSSTANVSFAYSPIYNRVASMTDGTGSTTYSYNPVNGALGAGRLASVGVPIAGSTATITYTYDELGRVLTRDVDQTITNANNTSMTYDALSRVTNVTNALGSFGYGYVDETPRLLSVTYPSGTGLSSSYSYFGNTSSDSDPADDDQRLASIQNMKGSTQLSKFAYTYNTVGTIATWSQQADSGTATLNTFTYDTADQLTNVAQSGGGSSTWAYGYDPAGNRLTETTLTGTTTGNFNNLNQLNSLTGTSTLQTIAGYTSGAVTNVTVNAVPATISNSTNFTATVPLTPGATNVVSVVAQPSSSTGTTTTQRYAVVTTGTPPATQLAYDANGNTTTDENGNNYYWDALNRLTAIVYNSGTNAVNHTEFAYDGLSRRTQIVERGGTTVGSGTITSTKNYLWVDSAIAEERDASNNVKKRFFAQGEQQSGTNYYYTRDQVGSVRELCSSTGAIVSRMAYDPYGRVTTVSGTVLPTKQYGGYYIHQTSGLSLTRYRAYDSNTGRWLGRDPIAEKGGLNLYGYALDDPIDLVDPLGLASTTMSITITPNGAYQPPSVLITAKSDCCKHLEFIQYTNARYLLAPFGSTTLDNPDTSTIFYPSTYIDFNHPEKGIQMPDGPAPGNIQNGGSLLDEIRGRLKAYMLKDLIQEFVTCAVCKDPGPNNNKILACIHWRVISNGVTSAGSAENYPPPQ
jgi:RHS repeat-associated protein